MTHIPAETNVISIQLLIGTSLTLSDRLLELSKLLRFSLLDLSGFFIECFCLVSVNRLGDGEFQNIVLDVCVLV